MSNTTHPDETLAELKRQLRKLEDHLRQQAREHRQDVQSFCRSLYAKGVDLCELSLDTICGIGLGQNVDAHVKLIERLDAEGKREVEALANFNVRWAEYEQRTERRINDLRASIERAEQQITTQ